MIGLFEREIVQVLAELYVLGVNDKLKNILSKARQWGTSLTINVRCFALSASTHHASSRDYHRKEHHASSQGYRISKVVQCVVSG